MDFFVEVEKDGSRLIIHPSTKKAHMNKGWRVVRDNVALEAKEKPKAEPEQPKTVPSKAKK
jgi:virulence-associated protein VagC